MVHEKNWRESLHVLEFHHPPNVPWILAATPRSQNTTSRSVPSWIPFHLFWDFIGLVIIRSSRSVTNRSWHVHWRDVTLSLISSFSSLNFTYCRWRRWAGRRWWAMTLLSWKCPWSWWRRTWQARVHNRNEVLRVEWNPNPVLNEMWFLTIDPFVGIPVFIAKLSERQYCWRVFENFQSQEYIQVFDIHCFLFMRLHFPYWR